METQKTYFDLIEDLYNYFMEKWRTKEKNYPESIEFENHIRFKKTCSLVFKNITFPNQNYVIGFSGDNNVGDKWVKKTRSFLLWTFRPEMDSTPEIRITAEKVIVARNDSSKGYNYLLRVNFSDLGKYFLCYLIPDSDCFSEILNKVREMVKSGEYADHSM
ncbi:MAG: hypothetical protein ABH817_02005 [archaeon]